MGKKLLDVKHTSKDKQAESRRGIAFYFNYYSLATSMQLQCIGISESGHAVDDASTYKTEVIEGLIT